MSKKGLLLYLNIGEINDEKYRYIKNIITEKRKIRVNKYLRQEDKIRCIMAEVLLKYAIYLYTGGIIDINYKYNKYGKPFLANYDQLEFNISHSGEWVVVAVGNCKIGIDVEYKNENWDLIFERSFSKLEKSWGGHEPKRMVTLWTIKEAYLKYLGIGLSKNMNSFSVDLENNVIIENQCEKKSEISFDYFFINEDYVCSECGYSRCDYDTREIYESEIDDFITKILLTQNLRYL